ncbi:zinc finger protein 32-like isoform X2 [Vanessa cardui]|uniref:zinc finger protein 32-like isoform X2 n=1 Tax=Vanessa cardui TaxID=171605 RepID=UPI001F13ACFE|nr:zinc finger protein 32-like isoform X2 [Vanessa cardui]
MAHILDFKKICRACLSDAGPLRELFSACTAGVFKYCTSVEVSDTDALPKLICQTCLDLLNKLYYFKQVVVRSNVILKQQCRLQNLQTKNDQQASEGNDIVEVNITELNEEVKMHDNNMSGDSSENLDRTEKPSADAILISQILSRRRRRGPGRPPKDPDGPKRRRERMKCMKCGKSFQKYENFEAHMRGHFGKKPDIKCKHCEKTFLSLRSLSSHVRIHTAMHLETHNNQKNYSCSQCGKKFAQPGNLKIHLIRHTGIKNYACTMCEMRFYIKADLVKHMRSHSAEKPFSCQLCDKTFKSRSFQAIHMRTHTGERPYACDLCPKKFMARKDLRNHRMIHTGEKPHKCQLCNQAFIQKCALNRHMKGHGKANEDAQNLIRAPLPPVNNTPPLPVAYAQWHTN